MKMSVYLQPTLWPETELQSMSLPEGFHAKTSALPESKLDLVQERAQDYGPKSSDLLAKYDHATSSWRTSQLCFLAQVNGEADGLAEFSGTWPNAGMMQSGVTYRLGLWDSLMSESVSGLWPTPSKNDGRGFYRISLRSAKLRAFGRIKRQLHWIHRAVLMQSLPGNWTANPRFSMELMGFPNWWVDLPPAETQSSRKSRK